jgi:hypothetical protein
LRAGFWILNYGDPRRQTDKKHFRKTEKQAFTALQRTLRNAEKVGIRETKALFRVFENQAVATQAFHSILCVLRALRR